METLNEYRMTMADFRQLMAFITVYIDGNIAKLVDDDEELAHLVAVRNIIIQLIPDDVAPDL